MTAAKRVAFGLVILFFLLAQPELARAKTLRVGNGTAASCTEDALRSALTFAEGEEHRHSVQLRRRARDYCRHRWTDRPGQHDDQ